MDKYTKEYEKLDQYDYSWDKDEIIFDKEKLYAEAIGRFLISFSALESSLNVLVAEAINCRSHDLGYHIIKSLTYNNKVHLAKDLYFQQIYFTSEKKVKEKNQKEFDIIFPKLLELGQFRNKIAHANWVTLDGKSNVRTKIELDDSGSVQFVKIKITPEIIDKHTSQCYQFLVRVDNFQERFQ